jgi:hypothetical protein
MTKADNGHFLVEAARRRSAEARRRTMQAIADLAAAGGPVTPSAVSRKAGVSRQWLYTFAEAQQAIQAAHRVSGPSPAGPPPGLVSWQRRVEALTDDNRRLRRKVKELEDLVAVLYGMRRSEQSGVVTPSINRRRDAVGR